MALEDWQLAAYGDLIDCYKARRGIDGDMEVNPTPFLTSVKCMYNSTENIDSPKANMMVKHDIILTLDRVHMEANLGVEVGDVIRLKTTGHAEYNSYFVIRGEGKEKPSFNDVRSNQTSFYINKISTPKGL